MTVQKRQPTDGVEGLVPRINASVDRGAVIEARSVLNDAPKLSFAPSLSKFPFLLHFSWIMRDSPSGLWPSGQN